MSHPAKRVVPKELAKGRELRSHPKANLIQIQTRSKYKYSHSMVKLGMRWTLSLLTETKAITSRIELTRTTLLSLNASTFA